MSLRAFYTVFLFFFSFTIYAQNLSEKVLFTIEELPVTASEFVRIYNKNLDLVQEESQKDVDQYLDLFINYKLKLQEARALKYDQNPSYIRELSSYKKQLSKNYVTDKKVTDKLVAEAYHRTVNEVNVSHILIRIPENAKPEDTLAAYNSMLNLRERVLVEGFNKIKNEFSNNKSDLIIEDLGFFSSFKMVYKFEDVAYKTNVGEVSMPFKTRFGYHILKVLDKRKSRGQRTVAHILVTNKTNDTLQTDSKTRIHEIYTKLNQGEAFDALAKQFSEDRGSSSKGGELRPFSGGELNSKEFENVAFSLQSAGDISKPFKTNYGWHIVKLLDKQEVKTFEDLKLELADKVKRDSRSKLINNALIDTLKKRYNVSYKQPDLEYFSSILNNNYYKRAWSIPQDFPSEKQLLKIKDKKITYRDFANHLIKNQRRSLTGKPFNIIVKEQYDSFLSNSLVQYQEDNLEFENKDFANILNEYRDGLLLFDLMENTIWNIAKTDSLGLKEYYNNNKNKYFFKEKIDAVVASGTKQKVINKVATLLKKNVALQEIKSKYNKDEKIEVLFTSSKLEKGDQTLPKDISFIEGVSKVYRHNDAFVVVKINKVIPQKTMSFNEAKGRVISDFQEYKEKEWLKDLRKKYKVTIDQEVLGLIKSQINN